MYKRQAKGTVIGNGDQEFIFKGTQTLSKGTYLMKGWIYVGTGSVLTIEPGTVIKGDKDCLLYTSSMPRPSGQGNSARKHAAEKIR